MATGKSLQTFGDMKTYLLTGLPLFCTLPLQAQLVIQGGSTFRTSGNTTVVLHDIGIRNNGGLSQDAGGRFLFTGSTNDTITGTAMPVFDTLQIAKTGSGRLVLKQTTGINRAVKFSSGVINLSGNTLALQPTALLIGENNSSYITDTLLAGGVSVTRALNAPTTVNPGNLGAVITSPQNLGATTIVRRHKGSIGSGAQQAATVYRQYEISPTNNNNLNATLRIQYLDHELNGQAENSIVFLKSSAPYTAFSDEGFNTRSTTTNYVEKTGIGSFSLWTLGIPPAVLPLQLLRFDAACIDNRSILYWTTAAEENILRFAVQKSMATNDWQTIGLLPPRGGRTSTNYSFTDPAAAPKGTLYRIVVHEQSGQYHYSPTYPMTCADAAGDVRVWPNPAQGDLHIALETGEPGELYLRLYDGKGALVRKQRYAIDRGGNQVELSMSSFATGMYQLVLQWGAEQQRTVNVVKR